MTTLVGFRKSLLASALAIGVMASSSASAQMSANYDNNVMVDLSVLNDGGMGRAPQISGGTVPTGSAVKLAPQSAPRSTFYGLPDKLKEQAATPNAPQIVVPGQEPKSRIVLRRPSEPVMAKPKLPTQQERAITLNKPTVPVVTVEAPQASEPAPAAPKPIVKAEAPEPVEAPKEVAKAVTPPPAPTPAPVKAVEVKEVKPVEVKKPEPVEEKVVEVVTPKPTPAPALAEVMAEAPPPPPPSAVEPKEVESAMKTQVEEAPKVAALPPQSGSSVRVAFGEGESKLPGSAQSELKALASDLNARPNDRVQLLAYAGGDELSASKARRLSLSRALAVRSYLIGEGVKSTRIDVRALGNKTTEEPFDRVDVKIAAQ